MGKIISVAGNLGAGKTTLIKLICEHTAYQPYWEQPEARPFQTRLASDPHRWAFTNQVDFFIYRCQQELAARQSDLTGVFDGGLDQDFHVFTRYIYQKGYLTADEYDVCASFYGFIRDFLPPPDLIIRIIVNLPTLLQRRAARRRDTVDQAFDTGEFTDFEKLLDEWLTQQTSSKIISFPFEQDYQQCTPAIEGLIAQIQS